MKFLAKKKGNIRRIKVAFRKGSGRRINIIVKPKPITIRKPIIFNYIPRVEGKKEEEEKKKGIEGREMPPTERKKEPFKLEITKPKPKIAGLPFPKIKQEITPIEKKVSPVQLKTVDIKYPLIPENPKRNEPIFAYAHIYWHPKEEEMRYDVIEPQLTEKEKELLETIKKYIKDKVDVDFTGLRKYEAMNYLYKKIDEALKYFEMAIPENLLKVMRYYIIRDFIGLEKIEPLMHDEHIEDISCDGVNIPIYVVHRDPRFGTLKTNIVFDSKEELDNFVIKLAQRCGKDISVARPLLDGILPDYSRVQATLSTDIARKGSNFTIRKFSKEPFTPTKLILYNTIDIKIGAYLWFAINYGRSILISGGTATGKTSMLNAISLFEKPENKIVTIEDTAELRLPHPNWVPEVAREAISVEGRGGVSLFDLLKAALRQRPDRIIVGEVRGNEAFVLFQGMATGHPGMATIHAESMETLIDRLTTPPINLPASLLEILDIIVFLTRTRIKNRFVRRVYQVVEIAGMDYKEKRPIVNVLFKWDPKKDNYKIAGKSVVLKKIKDRFGLTAKEIEEEIKLRAQILEWACERRITNLKDLAILFRTFYTNRKKLEELIKGEKEEEKEEKENKNK